VGFVKDTLLRVERLRYDIRQARRTGGLRNVVPIAANVMIRQTYRLVAVAQNYGFDRRHGIDTRGWRVTPAEVTARTEHGDGVDFEPTPVRELRKILDALPGIDLADSTFIDLGCGKGGPLAVAALKGFRRVVGVEMNGELAEVARANAEVLKARTPGTGTIEVVEGDATTYPLPPEPTLLYLYNPFGSGSMRVVAESVTTSLREHPRVFFVLYLNPWHRHVWEEVSVLRPIGSRPAGWWNRRVRKEQGWVLYASAEAAGDGTG
jgi:SAM-dependent methyltransferase